MTYEIELPVVIMTIRYITPEIDLYPHIKMVGASQLMEIRLEHQRDKDGTMYRVYIPEDER